MLALTVWMVGQSLTIFIAATIFIATAVEDL